MLSEFFLSAVQDEAGNRVVLPKVNQKQLNLVPVPVAPIIEQEVIATRLKSAIDWIESVSDSISSSIDDLTHLDQSILAKAFRGELVPQDPNDEPAAVLLERIRAERAAQEAASQRNGSPRRQRRQRIAPPAAASVNGNGKVRGKAKSSAPKNGKRGKSPTTAKRKRRRTVRR